MRKVTKSLILLTSIFLMAMSVNIASARAMRVDDLIWADGELYSTILTGASFNKMPPGKSLDILFMFGDSGLSGQRPVSEAGPGNPDYNGGRWSVVAVTFTPAGIEALNDIEPIAGVIDDEITSLETLNAYYNMGYLTMETAYNYFSCPLVK